MSFINPYIFLTVETPVERLRLTFEDGLEPPQLSSVGIVYNDQTAPSPLAGTYSMAGSTANAIASGSFAIITGTTYGYMVYATSMSGSTQGMFDLFNGNTRLFRTRTLSAGTIRIYKADGTTSHATSSAVITGNVPAHIWYDYTPGTGTNAVVNIYASPNATKPGSPTLTTTTLEATLGTDTIKFPVLIANTKCMWDNIIVSSENISSNPF